MHAHACGHLDGFGGVGTRSAQLHHLEERERALPGAVAPRGGGVAPKGSDKS